MNNPGVDLGLGTWHWRKPKAKQQNSCNVTTTYYVLNIQHTKLRALLYLSGLLTALDLIDSRLSKSDPISDVLQLPPILLYTVRNPRTNMHTRE